METDLPLSASEYAYMNSLYFGPNIVSPLLAGVVMKQVGYPSRSLAAVCGIAGNVPLIYITFKR